jgi:hypothetical protein
MPEPIFVIQTKWPHIRVALFRREDGLFQFCEQSMRTAEYENIEYSGLYDREEAARRDMLAYAEECQKL